MREAARRNGFGGDGAVGCSRRRWCGRSQHAANEPTTYNYCLGNLVSVSQTGYSHTARRRRRAPALARTRRGPAARPAWRPRLQLQLARPAADCREPGELGYDQLRLRPQRQPDQAHGTGEKHNHLFRCSSGIRTCDGLGYDFLNRATRKVYSDTATPGTTFTYDDPSVPCSRGRLTKATTDQVGSLASVIRSIASYNCAGQIGGLSRSRWGAIRRAHGDVALMYNFAGGMTQEVLPSREGRWLSLRWSRTGAKAALTGLINGNPTTYATDDHGSDKLCLCVFGSGGASGRTGGRWAIM